MNLLMCVHVSHSGHRCDSWLATMSTLQQQPHSPYELVQERQCPFRCSRQQVS